MVVIPPERSGAGPGGARNYGGSGGTNFGLSAIAISSEEAAAC